MKQICDSEIQKGGSMLEILSLESRMSQNYEEFIKIKKKADAIQNQPNFANYVIEDPNVMG